MATPHGKRGEVGIVIAAASPIMIPFCTYADTAQLWLWAVYPGCRLVVSRAEPLPMPTILPITGV